jgi:hypothetical protein
MALIAIGGDLEFARALNQMKEAANCGGLYCGLSPILWFYIRRL